jgi:TPR repeat protein
VLNSEKWQLWVGDATFDKHEVISEAYADMPKDSPYQEDIVTYYEFAAERKDSKAQVFLPYKEVIKAILAQLYYFGGHYTKPNYEKAYHYAKDCATTKHAICYGILGYMHFKGQGKITANQALAIKFWKEGADLGSSMSLNGLGIISLKSKDDISALKYFKKAADKEHPEAQYHYAKLLSKCLNTP